MNLKNELCIAKYGIVFLLMALGLMSLMFFDKTHWELYYVAGLILFIGGAFIVFVSAIGMLVKVCGGQKENL